MTHRARQWMALITTFALLAPALAGATPRPAPSKRAGTARVERAQRARVARTSPRVRAARAPRSEEERALLALEQDGERRVKALLGATRGWTDKAMLAARDRRIAEMRRDTRARQFQLRAAFARRRGDHSEAAALEREAGPGPRGRRRGA
jgi:hypothetical protein